MPFDPDRYSHFDWAHPILVTGGAGFIGSHLVEALRTLGAEVRVLDDLTSGHRTNLPASGVRFHEGSILDEDALANAIAGCRLVFHQAAMVSVPQSVAEPARCMRVNAVGTQMILEAARAAGVERVMFASSAAVYGDEPSLPSRETDTVDCRSPYAASKAAGEALLSAYAHGYGLSTVSLRYFNVFGPRQDPDSPYAAAVAAFHAALAGGRTPTIFGDGRQTRDFVAIANIVHANLLAASCPGPLTGEAINVGTGRAITLLDLVAALGRVLGVDSAPAFGEPRPGDVRHSTPDITRARELLGYEPIEDLDAGLTRLVNAAV
ncbi:MAG: NAD-dependent epimerase/dehydratase family protein [Phycisphaerae bacterium]|nr:NAD-dependent epimerase/dehydratase family protein [Phycisphaerae bacterium]